VKPLRFLPAAQGEYRAALAWYASKSLDAATDFASAIGSGLRGIRETPEAWPSWRGRRDVRARVMRRFPYTILYVIRDEGVVVVAVAHQHRAPGYWLTRLHPR
jgi:toxin ParE1/3/4